MDLDRFLSELNPDPLVQKKKKYQTFTVKEIGGPAEIVKWREMQAAKESAYRVTLKSRDERLSEFEEKTGQRLDEPTIHTSSWAEKQAFATSERARLAQLVDVASSPWLYESPEVPTFFQKVARFFKRLWADANF